MDHGDSALTIEAAFVTKSGVYQFNVLPFGLTGAPGAFCRYVDEALRDLMWNICLVFVDDIVVFSEDFDSHFDALGKVWDSASRTAISISIQRKSLQFRISNPRKLSTVYNVLLEWWGGIEPSSITLHILRNLWTLSDPKTETGKAFLQLKKATCD